MRLTYKAQDQYGKETGTVWYASTAGNSIFPKSDKEEQALKKLAAYEDAEEQGRLMILPCTVGDALFVTNEGTCLPAVRMVELVAWYNGKVFIRAVNNRTGIEYYCSAEDFGKTVFLTREEAKAAMKGEKKAEADIIEELSKMPIPVRPFFLSCNCEEKYERTDCIHYDEEQDMGAHIPFCRLYKRSGYCPCLGCEKYERRVKLPEPQKEEKK